jgi:hypothetical protein
MSSRVLLGPDPRCEEKPHGKIELAVGWCRIFRSRTLIAKDVAGKQLYAKIA